MNYTANCRLCGGGLELRAGSPPAFGSRAFGWACTACHRPSGRIVTDADRAVYADRERADLACRMAAADARAQAKAAESAESAARARARFIAPAPAPAPPGSLAERIINNYNRQRY